MAKEYKNVFVVHPPRKKGDDSQWRKCGVCFVNEDGSLSLRLDVLPDTNFQIRDPKEREPGQEG